MARTKRRRSGQFRSATFLLAVANVEEQIAIALRRHRKGLHFGARSAIETAVRHAKDAAGIATSEAAVRNVWSPK